MLENFNGEEYLSRRSGCYEYRAVRYRMACDTLFNSGLNDSHSLVDVGAGWTELDYTLRREYDWRGRYIPLDFGISSIDLNNWNPLKIVDYYAALEIIEHLYEPSRIVEKMLESCLRGVVITVPDPENVDVFAMDDTHVSKPDRGFLEGYGFTVESVKLYGGVYSSGSNDALFAHYFK